MKLWVVDWSYPVAGAFGQANYRATNRRFFLTEESANSFKETILEKAQFFPDLASKFTITIAMEVAEK